MKAILVQRVQWRPGRRFNVKAEVAHHALEVIRKKYQNLEPPTVIKEAKHANHPLHRCFLWDDDKAAQNWREHQARRLINSIEVVYEEQANGVSPKTISIAPCYVSNPLENGYLKTDDAIEDIDTRGLVIAAALSCLNGFKDRYGRLKEMAEVVDAINRTEREVKSKPKKAKVVA